MKRTVQMVNMSPGVSGFTGRHGVRNYSPKQQRSMMRRHYRDSMKSAEEKLEAAERAKDEKLTIIMKVRVDEFKAKLASIKPMVKTFLRRATGRG